MNNNISTCAGCSGKGEYKILNAYDPEYEETVVCEHCEGTGYPKAIKFSVLERDRQEDWTN